MSHNGELEEDSFTVVEPALMQSRPHHLPFLWVSFSDAMRAEHEAAGE
ncbi:MAG: hypothetical protein AAGA54_21295 [Myxococcota bacterium]